MPTPRTVLQDQVARAQSARWRDGFIYGSAAGMTFAALVVIAVCWFSGIHLCR